MSLPARFRRRALLIVGCGDVGLRVARQLNGRLRLLALTHSEERAPALRAAGVVPLRGDLDTPATLVRLAGLAPAVLHLAPPPGEGDTDPRTRRLLQALSRGTAPARLVYGSTSGVYGDCGGAWVDETRRPAPATPRARRRVDAERRLRAWGRSGGTAVTVLRIPGIYALDRQGGDPRERVRAGTPVLRPEDDVHTNHIHADDLARACVLALFRGRPQRVVNVADDTDRTAGDQAVQVAALCGLPPPPRIGRAEAERTLSPMRMSFLSESRRLRNARLKRELRLRLRWPTVDQALRAAPPPAP
ncbi:NAD-dependent epimerase/dehydratase family protein [Aquabacterium sp. J223]|uniref:NAD-dependent epimerase/dehydratase family protein n=1 Tax=Aquabacterium sp. J223 TaxID=2898431 RepID=UPI0021AE2444|nr:NAD-dependent epimerase/dehydratase family protein [Aquabacterium sp. J223]UUX95531.1 NAD-dependent epimerase/dehydratase family protein [Aquabacterium sp. J223]